MPFEVFARTQDLKMRKHLLKLIASTKIKG